MCGIIAEPAHQFRYFRRQRYVTTQVFRRTGLVRVHNPTLSFGQTTGRVLNNRPLPAKAVYSAPKEVIDKIRDEGMNHSQVMQTLGYLIGCYRPTANRLAESQARERMDT